MIKILLGEVANSRKAPKLAHILASRADILQALFERTYESLSPAAQRVFLTLCGWRSAVPQLVLEAVILHSQREEAFDVSKAVEELHRSSLIEISGPSEDTNTYLSVPLVAALFGRGKFETSPLNAQLRSDIELLQYLGAVQRADTGRGVDSRIRRFVRSISKDAESMQRYQPMLEFLARRSPSVWLELSELYEEIEDLPRAKDSLRHYMEQTDKEQWLQALSTLARLSAITNDLRGEIDALVKQAELGDVPYRVISSVVNRFNSAMRAEYSAFSADEKRVFAERLRQVMEAGLDEANATDLSRLAWLCLRLSDEPAADKYILQGLRQEPDNEYCLRLAESRGLK